MIIGTDLGEIAIFHITKNEYPLAGCLKKTNSLFNLAGGIIKAFSPDIVEKSFKMRS